MGLTLDPFRRLVAMSAGKFSDGTSAPPLVRGADSGDVPLTFFQETRWERLRGNPLDRYFLDGFAQRLVGPLDRGALERSLDRIVARHDTLRTSIRMDRPIASLAASGSGTLAVVDQPGASDAELQARAVELLFAPLDITRDPVFRPYLLRIAEDDHVLLLSYHTLALNRPAVELLLADWAACYAAERAGVDPAPPRARFQFADFARWQRTWLVGAELERRLARATARLAGSRPIRLPTDHPRPAEAAPARLGYKSFRLADDLARDVIAFSRERGTTFSTLLSALAVLLHARTGAPDITLKVIAQALHRATHGMIGLLAGLAIVRIDLADDPPLSVVGERAIGALLDALEDQMLPWARVPGSLVGEPDVLIDAIAPGGQELVWQGLTTRAFELDHHKELPGRFDLECFIWLRDERDQLFGFIYNAELFDAETVDALGRDHHRILRAMIDAPEQRLSQLVATVLA